MKKIKKGDFGYLSCQKKKEVALTAGLFLLSLAVYLIGLITTGDNKNLLTVVAVLGCLPASKCAVNMIVVLKSRGCTPVLHEGLIPHIGDTPQLYDMVFTSYELTYEIPHMALKGNTLVGFCQNSKGDAAACEKHLLNLFSKSNIRDVSIKIFKDQGKYKNRLDQLQKLEADTDKAGTVFSLLKAISL